MMAEEVAGENAKVFLKGLPANATKSTITNAFTEFGTVTDVIFKYTHGKKIKGLGYVIFEAQESADACLTKQAVTIEDRKVEVKKARDGDKQAEEDALESIPKEALKCFVCKRDHFPSVRVYLNHRKGKQHQAVLKVFKTKSAAVLQLLRAEAKLAADRCFDKTWMNKSTKDTPTTCLVCQCHLSCNPETHEKSMEHKMVVSYNNQKCCDIQYTERSKYEIHLLSLKHLKNMYAKEKQNEDEETRLTMKRAIDIYKQCDADLKELKDSYPLLDLADELPEFDPNTPLGVHFVVKKINYHCMCCDQKFFPQVNFIEPHCRSYDHYSNMTDYISSLEQKNAKKRKNRGDDGKPGKKSEFCISGDTFVMKGEKKTEADEKETTPVKSVSVKVKNEVIKKEDKEKEDPVQKSDDVENVGEDDDAKNLEEQTEVVDEQDPKVAEGEEEVEAMEEQEDEGMEDEEAEVENEDEGDGEDDVEGEVEEYDDAEEVQEVDNEEVQEVYDVEDQDDDQSAEENSSEIPTKAPEREEEEVMEVEEVAPSRRVVRGRRARGRGRALKR